ncbi:MAG: hypothetical protein ACREIT_01390 [Tepidisphaeraceae bacterium]
MRSLILTFLTLALLACGLAAYLLLQDGGVAGEAGGDGASGELPVAATFPTTGEGIQGIHGGEGMWVKQFDAETGELVSQFRGARFDPRKDGTVFVTHPEAEFFLGDGQVLRIEGRDGVVVLPDTGTGEQTAAGLRTQARTPTRGKLYDVKLTLYPSTDAVGDETRAAVVAEMNNAAFDNDTLRITTEGYTDDAGRAVAADQVPVLVRGEYEFEGQGLTVRWNERDRRLQMLEVARGGRLVIKDPKALSTQPGRSRRPRQARVPHPPEAALAADTVAPDVAPVPATAPSRGRAKATSPPYRATFHGDVHIVQDDAALVLAELMHIDFMPKRNLRSDLAAASRTSPAVSAPGPTSHESSSAATPAPVVAEHAKTAPTSQPSESPIIITWTGKLRLAPLESGEPDASLVPGEAVVRLVGAPVVVTRDGGRIESGLVTYQTLDERVMLHESEQTPLVMTDADGAKVTTRSMDYSARDRVALLRGKSRAIIPIEGRGGADDEPTTLLIDWSEFCKLTMGGGGRTREDFRIERAELVGDVDVNHPQLELKSGRLALDFTPPAEGGTSPRKQGLRSLVAEGDVHCDMVDTSRKRQSIEADRLELEARADARGDAYPHVLRADGRVRASSDEEELQADHLLVELAVAEPTTREASSTTHPAGDLFAGGRVEVKQVIARDAVKVKTGDGAVATADEMTADMEGREADAELKGRADKPARIANGDNVIVGPLIKLSTARHSADVIGAGSLHAIQQARGDAPPRPMDVSWSDSLAIDGRANVVNVTGDVVATSTNPDGSVSTASGKRARMVLADKPTTAKPAGAPNKTAAKDETVGPPDFLGEKLVQSIALDEGVEVRTVLAAEDGSLLRRVNLLAESVRYDLTGRRAVVPVPGRILYEDRRPPTNATRQRAAHPVGDSRGATAIQWNKDLVYDEAARQAILSGGVVIVYQSQENAKPGGPPAGRSFRLDAEKVTAFFNGVPAGAKVDPKAPESQIRLERLRAEGKLHFATEGLEFDAARVDFDPNTDMITAVGSDDAPAVLYDGSSTVTVRSITYNLRTGEMKSERIRASGRRESARDLE